MNRLIGLISAQAIVMVVCCATAAIGQDGDSGHISFVRDVAPILVGKCQACHGPKTAESNYRLDSFELFMQYGDHGTAPITPEDLEDSEVYRLVVSEDPDERMPANGDRLSDAELATLAAWIEQGAKFDGANATAPLREQIPHDIPHPAAPAVYSSALPVTAIAFTNDGAKLLVSGYHELLVCDAATGALDNRIGNMPERALGLALSPSGDYLAVAGGSPGVSGEVRLIPWQGHGPRPEAAPAVLTRSDDVFFAVDFRPDGQELAAGGADGSVRAYNVASGVERLKIENHADWVNDLCFSPDGRSIATASRDKSAKVFDAATGTLVATYSEHETPVRAVAFAPDGTGVISAGAASMRHWKIDDSSLIGDFAGFQGEIYAAITAGDRLLGASADRTAKIFAIADRSLQQTFADHSAWVISLAWHGPTNRIVAGCYDGSVAVWDGASGQLITRFVAQPGMPAASDR